MATWIQCISALDDQPIFVNMEAAATFQAIKGRGTHITFPGGTPDDVVVRDEPNQIIELWMNKKIPDA